MLPPPQSPPASNPAIDAVTDVPSSWATRFVSSLLGAIVWLGANALLALVVFAWRPLSDFPLLWRLVAGILANFYLIPMARSVSTESRNRIQARRMQGPFPADLI
jgi:hypothetical protein